MSRTLTIIKPDAMQKGYAGKILDKIINAGFTITALKMIHLRTEEAQQFYAVHKEKDFYNLLVEFMCQSTVIVAILEKDDAVNEFRKLIGNTNPEKAEENTIRKLFGTSMRFNAIHGSDSDATANFECNFFFPFSEKFDK